jgi:hypothetical protein
MVVCGDFPEDFAAASALPVAVPDSPAGTRNTHDRARAATEQAEMMIYLEDAITYESNRWISPAARK